MDAWQRGDDSIPHLLSGASESKAAGLLFNVARAMAPTSHIRMLSV